MKEILNALSVKQVQVAKALDISAAAVAQIINHGLWPKRTKLALQTKLKDFLVHKGADVNAVNAFLLSEETASSCEDGAANNNLEVEPMLLRKQSLLPTTKQYFKIIGNPFAEISDHEDVFLNQDMRYAKLQMEDAAKRGGFCAIIGESGSGKTTLKNDLIDKIKRDNMPIVVIQPYVLAMEDSDLKGKTLKSSHIVEAILREVAPHMKPYRSAEAKFRQVDMALRESAQQGHKHVLIIEEAHSLPIPTLKHLKRFLELQDGFTKLLSVILIGQTELGTVLSEKNPAVREVVQRCELIHISSLGTTLEDYLNFRFKRTNNDLRQCIDPSGIQAIYERLQPAAPKGHKQRTLLFPLAANNLAIASLNLAAQMGAPKVTEDIVMEVVNG